MINTAVDQGAGVLALLFFGWAWWTNFRAEGKWAGIVAVVLGICGSLLLYAAPWSIWLAERFADILGIFGDGTPVHAIMSVICVAAIMGTVIDLWFDASYNPTAVWTLIVAPVMARGSSGYVGQIVEGVYGGLALGVLDAVKDILGA